MNFNEANVGVTMTRREAMLIRAALHIATALTTEAHRYSIPELAKEFDDLHSQFRDAGFENADRDKILLFEQRVLGALKDLDTDILRQVSGGLVGREIFGEITHRPSGGKSALSQMLALQELAKAGLTHTDRMIYPTADEVRSLQLKQTIAKPEVRGYTGWKVQFNVASASDPEGDWLVVSQLGTPRTSRNDAYRAMRERQKAQGAPIERYRVVPADHPEGPEKDRGYYQIELWDEDKWRDSYVLGPQRFVSADAARSRLALLRISNPNATYRVKWHPNKRKS